MTNETTQLSASRFMTEHLAAVELQIADLKRRTQEFENEVNSIPIEDRKSRQQELAVAIGRRLLESEQLSLQRRINLIRSAAIEAGADDLLQKIEREIAPSIRA